MPRLRLADLQEIADLQGLTVTKGVYSGSGYDIRTKGAAPGEYSVVIWCPNLIDVADKMRVLRERG